MHRTRLQSARWDVTAQEPGAICDHESMIFVSDFVQSPMVIVCVMVVESEWVGSESESNTLQCCMTLNCLNQV